MCCNEKKPPRISPEHADTLPARAPSRRPEPRDFDTNPQSGAQVQAWWRMHVQLTHSAECCVFRIGQHVQVRSKGEETDEEEWASSPVSLWYTTALTAIVVGRGTH